MAVFGIFVRILWLNIFPHLVVLVMNHVYRLSHEGKVCAGVYLTELQLETYYPYDEYLIFRGEMLYNILMFYWVVLAVLCGAIAFIGAKLNYARQS